MAVVVVLVAILIARQRPWVADFWLHAATIDRLSADLWHPGNPVVAEQTGSPYYTPYTWLLGLIAHLTGLSGIDILTLWAPVNVALLLWGIHAFSKRFSPSPWAPVVLLPVMLLLWGQIPLGWSGFMTLFGLPLIMAYPSTFAFALTLLLWSMLLRLLDDAELRGRRGWLWSGGFAALAVLVVLSHQFTGVLAALGSLAILIGRLRGIDRRLVLMLGTALLAGVALVLIWPFYDMGDLLGSVAILDSEHTLLYASWRPLYLYAIVAIPFLALRFWRDRLDPLVLMALIGGVIVIYGWWSGHFAWGRVIPLVIFAGQAAAAFEVVQWPAWRYSPAALGRIALAGALLVACALGLSVQGGNLLYVAPPSTWPARLVSATSPTPPPADFSWLTEHARRGDVVATIDQTALRTIPAYGFNVVAPAWPDPLLPDEARRRTDQQVILDPATDPSARRSLLARYQVKWILLVNEEAARGSDFAPAEIVSGPQGELLLRMPA